MRRSGTPYTRVLVTCALALTAGACGVDDHLPTNERAAALYTTPTGLVTANPPQIFIGAGDIASCSKNDDELTARILDTIPGTVYILGDNVYENGSTSEYANCYDPTWGRHKARTKPSSGNHDYNTSGATPYYNYFGASAGDPSKGYYSYNLGAWHVIVLNSNISKSASSPQVQWLNADLAANQGRCTLAYFHHPIYSSTGGSGSSGVYYSSTRPFLDALYAGGADVYLAGHRHFYERLGPMAPNGTSDPVNGVRTFIVGSGGIGGGGVTNVHPRSEVRNGDTRGVLKMYLYDDSYAWKFIPIAGKTFSDTGSVACKSAGAPPPGGGISASNSAVTASPGSITASSGSSTSTITITVRDGSNNPVSGATVTLSATGTGNTLTQPGPTNASGATTGVLRSTVAETKVVSAVANGVALNATPSVTVTPAPPAALAFLVQPTSTQTNTAITPAVQVEIRDEFGNRVTTATNSVTMGINANPGSSTLGGTTTVAASAGVASFSTLTLNNAGTGYTLAATAATLAGATSATFNVTAVNPVSASQSSVAAAPASVTAGSGTATITVTARNASGNPVSGVPVTLSATGSGNTVTQPGAVTDPNGVATGTVSSTVAGAKIVSATANGVALTATATVTITAGPPSAATSTVSASPTTISVGGSSSITTTVKDAYGNPVSGVAVTLTASGTGNTITPPGSTNASGVATGAISSTVAEDKVVSASVGGGTIGQTVVQVTNAPPAAITHTLLTAGNNTVNQKVYTTASIAPASNALVTLAVLGHRSSGANPSPTVTGGGMSAWVEVATVTLDPLSAPLKRVTIFRAMSASPGSGPLTITYPSSVSNTQWIVSQWTGVETSGTDGSGAVGQLGVTSAEVVNGLTVTLGAFSHAANAAYGVFAVNSQVAAITPGAGFAEISEQPSAESPYSSLMAEWALNRPAIGATWASLRGGAIGVEIKAKTTP